MNRVYLAFGFLHDRTLNAFGALCGRSLNAFGEDQTRITEAPYIIIFGVKTNDPKVVFLAKSL